MNPFDGIEPISDDLMDPLVRMLAGARLGHVKAVEESLEEGVSVNATDAQGWTALHCAARVNQPAVADLLLRRGADSNRPALNGETPLLAAAAGKHVEMVRMLLKHGADPNLPGKNGWTPLMVAALSGNVEMVDALLENGADPDRRDASGVDANGHAMRGPSAGVVLERLAKARGERMQLKETGDLRATYLPADFLRDQAKVAPPAFAPFKPATCRRCGGPVEPAEASCPKCGQPREEMQEVVKAFGMVAGCGCALVVCVASVAGLLLWAEATATKIALGILAAAMGMFVLHVVRWVRRDEGTIAPDSPS